jgi:hypothetical protein
VVVLSTACLITEASFESQCVVEGSEVNFHCPNEESWLINSVAVLDGIPGVLNFTTSEETGRDDYLTVTAGSTYVEEFSNTSLIHCSQRNIRGSLFAMLVVTSKPLHQLHSLCS